MTLDRSSLNAVATAIVALDSQGRICFANQALMALTGHEAATLLGRSIDALLTIGPGDGSTFSRIQQSLSQCSDMQATASHASGEPIALRLSARAERAELVLTLHDRRTEQQLQAQVAQRDELLSMAREFGRLGVWQRDARTLQGQWDQQTRRFWGLPTDAATHDFQAISRFIDPQDREQVLGQYRESLQQPGNYASHYRVTAADGQIRRLHSHWKSIPGTDGKPERLQGVVVDDTEVWRMARSVDETKAQLELALELGHIAVWRHDLKTQRLYYSAEGWRILGMAPRPDGLSLDEVRALIHPDDLPHVRASMERALRSGAPVDMEARYRHADGRWLDILTRRVTQLDAAGQPTAFIGVGMDMTERLQEQRRVLELSKRLELAASAAGVAIWTYDVATRRAHWNAQMYTLHGLSPSEPPPRWQAYLHRFVLEPYRDIYDQSLRDATADASGRIVEVDVRIVRTDGSVRDVAVRARLQIENGEQRLLGVMLDVTEQRTAQLALRKADERALLAARGAGVGTWELDLSDQSAVWDEQMWRLRGLEPRNSAPPNAEHRLAMVHPDDAPIMRKSFDDALREHRPSSIQFRVRWPDGSWHWLASRTTPVFDDQGREVRRIGVNWDVTEAREAEQANQARLLAQAESQAKSRFLARMSHELRTPLNAVIGFAELLLSDSAAALGSASRQHVEHIRGAGAHLLALVNDVLDLSSLESGEIRIEATAIHLRELIATALPMVQALALSHQVQVQVQRDAIDPVVIADPTRLRQVLLNLLTNAIKYNRAGGSVLISAQARAEMVALRVCDSGRGMSAEQLAHAFEPFNRLGLENHGIEGTGIGLAIVKANVERMGGTVQVDSRPGEGTQVEVCLPAGFASGATLPAAAPAVTPAVTPAHSGRPAIALAARTTRSARLLYIEDNPVNALIVRELINQRGDLQLHEAADGWSGVAQARSARPDLILIDMQLPDIDGLEVLHQLRLDASTAAIPCIALSANAMPEDIQIALGAGFADYWTKPLDFRVFTDTLDTLFGKLP